MILKVCDTCARLVESKEAIKGGPRPCDRCHVRFPSYKEINWIEHPLIQVGRLAQEYHLCQYGDKTSRDNRFANVEAQRIELEETAGKLFSPKDIREISKAVSYHIRERKNATTRSNR